MIQDGFIEEKSDSGRSFYSKTVSGELFHRLLKNGNVMQALLRVSGKKTKVLLDKNVRCVARTQSN